MLSSRNELKLTDTCSAKPSYVPQPNDEQDVSCSPDYPVSLPRYAGYEARSCAPSPLDVQSDYRRPYPGINSAADSQSVVAVPRQWPQESPPAAWCRGRWQGQRPLLTAHHPLLPKDCVLRRFWHDPWGLGLQNPPKTRLAQDRISCLPLPVHAAQFLTILDKYCPYPIQQTQLYPALECAMDRAVVGKVFGQAVPLTAGSHPEDNRVQSSPQVDTFSARVFGWVLVLDNWFYLVPQFVWHFPNRWQSFNSFSFLGHLRLLSLKVHRWLSAKLCVLR